MQTLTPKSTPRTTVTQITEQLLQAERVRSERLLNTVRSVVLIVLAVGAALYSPRLSASLNAVNVAVLLPMLFWTLWQQIAFRRGKAPSWLSNVNGAVDITALSLLLGGYAIFGTAMLAVASPMMLVYFVIIAAQPLTRSARHAAAVSVLAAVEYGALIILLVATQRLVLSASNGPGLILPGPPVVAPLIDQIARIVFFLVAGGVASYAALRHEGVLRNALLGEVQRGAEERELASRLQEADQLAAVGTLAATVAHEVSAPLSSITMLAEFLQKSNLSEAQREDVNGILEESRRTSDVVKELLRVVYRQDAGDGPISLTDIVNRSLSTLRPMLRDQEVEVKTKLASQLPSFAGQSIRLEQVLLNLMINAVQAMEGRTQPKEIHVTTGYDAARVWVIVEDTGPGFSRGTLEQIFERFFTTKSVGKGTGLGLWIARDIVTNHGGSLTASNRAEGGARFDLIFPVRESVA